MASLVIKLQQEALDKSIQTADLLRKALVVARKLQMKDIQPWLKSELNGYSEPQEIPGHRSVHGEIKVLNSYNMTLMPIMFSESMGNLHRSLTRRKCAQSVAEIEDLLESKSGMLIMPYPSEITARLMNQINSDFPPVLVVSGATLKGILDATRTAVLEWALQLEEQGITGESLLFSKEEQKAASNVTFHIESMSHSQIQGWTSGSTQSFQGPEISVDAVRCMVKELNSAASELKLIDVQRKELNQEIATIEAQLGSPKPKSTILHESLLSIRKILEGAAGSALATNILTRVNTLIGG